MTGRYNRSVLDCIESIPTQIDVVEVLSCINTNKILSAMVIIGPIRFSFRMFYEKLSGSMRRLSPVSIRKEKDTID